LCLRFASWLPSATLDSFTSDICDFHYLTWCCKMVSSVRSQLLLSLCSQHTELVCKRKSYLVKEKLGIKNGGLKSRLAGWWG
jgi:hypothetical protein